MRITAKQRNEYPWYLWPFFWNQRRKYGAVLGAALLWGRTPRVFMAVAFLYGMLDRSASPVAPALRSLVAVRVSQINGCRFCVDLNGATMLRRGVSPEKLDALEVWRDNPLFDEIERAALEYAEAMTRCGLDVDDALMSRLGLHFDPDAVVELTGLIAFQNMSSKFNAALAVPSQGFCPVPAAVPAPASEPARDRKGGDDE